MLMVSESEIITAMVQYFYPFCRIGTFFLIVPIIGTRLVSIRIRLVLAMTVTLLVVPSIEVYPDVDPLSADSFRIVFDQMSIGLFIGFMIQLLFQICVLGGQIIAIQNGLGFSTLIDPVNGINVASISQLYLMASNLIFLAMNGHLWLIQALALSFNSMPIGEAILIDNYLAIANMGSWIFNAALMVSLPAVAAILLVNLAFGIMSKVAPQLNIFSIGFPMVMIFGLVIIWVTMESYLPQFERFSLEAFEMINEFLNL